MSFKPTAQQEAVLVALGALPIGGRMQIRACAGSGKTSTLKLCARKFEVPSVYLCFNKQTATEAAQDFPDWVDCRTGHSVAFRAVGKPLADKLKRPSGGYVNVAMTGSEIAQFFRVDPIYFGREREIMLSGAYLGMLSRQTVSRFEQSADFDLEAKHVPVGDLSEKLQGESSYIATAKKAILKVANKLWEERTDPKSRVLITPDTFLKLYQLSKPVLRTEKVGVPEILYVDEFQDTTPCVLDIVLRQNMKIVMVGDARQAIYGWRGAVNAMEMVQCGILPLTQSFRYGQRIADIATSVLERDMVIQGNPNINSLVGNPLIPDSPKVKRSKPYTRLFRTNAALLTSAIADIKKGRSVNIEIDTKDFVKFLESADALYHNEMKKVKHDKLLAFKDWDEAVAESKHDPDIGRAVKVIKEGLIRDWIDTLQHHENVYEPHITYTTAHKSKGREWKQVIVESDFKSCYDEDGEWKGLTIEEQNLLYVANTRAIDVLEYNQTTQEYLNREMIA